MGLQVPAALAALGSHEILKLGDLFVKAVDVLVKEPTEKLSINHGVLSQHLSHMDISGRDGRVDITSRGDGISDRPEGPAGIVQALYLAQAQCLRGRARKR